MDTIDIILSYCLKGLKVFPLYGIRDGACTCWKEWCEGNDRGKHPRLRNGFKGATDKADSIRKWWTKWPDANVGIRTGAASGTFVLDIDGEEGEKSLQELQKHYGPLPETWEDVTGTGRHLYFNSDNLRIPCSQSSIASKLDIRGDGGYVVAPPSNHFSGRPYQWKPGHSPDDLPLADAPAWLIELALEKGKNKKDRNADKVKKHASKNQGQHDEDREDPFIYESRPSRNRTLLDRACHMRDKGVSHKIIKEHIELLNEYRCIPPLPKKVVQKILRQALEKYPPRPSYRPGLSEGSKKVHGYLVKKSQGNGSFECKAVTCPPKTGPGSKLV